MLRSYIYGNGGRDGVVIDEVANLVGEGEEA